MHTSELTASPGALAAPRRRERVRPRARLAALTARPELGALLLIAGVLNL